MGNGPSQNRNDEYDLAQQKLVMLEAHVKVLEETVALLLKKAYGNDFKKKAKGKKDSAEVKMARELSRSSA